jgi:hypothetical protein
VCGRTAGASTGTHRVNEARWKLSRKHAPDGATAGTAVVGASVGECVGEGPGLSVGAGVVGASVHGGVGEDVVGASVHGGVGEGVVGASVTVQTHAPRFTTERADVSIP